MNLFFKTKQNSIIPNPFDTQLIIILACNCNKSNFFFQNNIDIPLIKFNNTKNINNLDLLNKYFDGELVDVTYSCEFRKKK